MPTSITFGELYEPDQSQKTQQTTQDAFAYKGDKPESYIMGTIIGGLLLIALIAFTALCVVTFRQIKKEWASRRIRQGVFVAIVWVVSSSFALFLSYLESGFYLESGSGFAVSLVFVPPLLAGLLFYLYRKIVG